MADEHAAAANRTEQAASALAIKALELDNRALAVERDEAHLVEKQCRLEEKERQINRAISGVGERETLLAAREAGLKYSAVEQKRLHDWASRLEQRERRVGDAELREKERIADRIATVTKRELLVSVRERRIEAAIKEREATLERRESVAKSLLESVEKRRADALLRIEAERQQFWEHQQKLSAVVAAETEDLLAEQIRLRTEFEGEAAAARRALKMMTDSVAKMKLRIDTASTADQNAATHGDDDDDMNGVASLSLDAIHLHSNDTTRTANGDRS